MVIQGPQVVVGDPWVGVQDTPFGRVTYHLAELVHPDLEHFRIIEVLPQRGEVRRRQGHVHVC